MSETALVAGLDLLTLGVPVQVILPDPKRKPIEILPEDSGRLHYLLASHPENGVAVLITDAPDAAVLAGRAIPRAVLRRRQQVVQGEVGVADRTSDLPLDRVLGALEGLNYRVKRKGRQWRARCPHHGGSSDNSFSIAERADGKVAVHCFSGCSYEDVLSALGLQPSDLYPNSGEAGGEIRHSGSASTSEAPSPIALNFKTAWQIAQETPERPQWVIEGQAALGAITELTGAAKRSGKTTYTMRMLAAKLDGLPFLGRPTLAGPAVVLTEERTATFIQSLRRAGLLERRDLHILIWSDAYGAEWPTVVEQARAKAREVGANLLEVDTLPSFAGMVGDAENSAGEALTVMGPLHLAAAGGLAVWVNRHDRRAGGEVGESGRGSTAFTGAVDISLHLKRPGGIGRENARELEGVGRFDEIPSSLFIELGEDGYTVLGSAADIKRQEAGDLLLEYLPDSEDEAVTLPSLWARPREAKDGKPATEGGPLSGTKIGTDTFRRAAEGLLETGKVARNVVNPRKQLWWRCVSDARGGIKHIENEASTALSGMYVSDDDTPIGVVIHTHTAAPGAVQATNGRHPTAPAPPSCEDGHLWQSAWNGQRPKCLRCNLEQTP